MVKVGVKVEDAMAVAPTTVSADRTITACAKLMTRRKVGSLLIVKGNALQGIVTEKDLVYFLSKGLNPKKVRIGEIMTRRLHTIEPGVDLTEAFARMKKAKVRRLPVVHDKKLIGMLTQNDLFKLQPALFDIVYERARIGKPKVTKEKYMEGVCDVCENFAQLHLINDQWICGECMEEEGVDVHSEDEES